MPPFAVDLHLLSIPLVEPFEAAHGSMENRELTVIRVGDDDGEGWGECSALSSPTYTNEFAAGAYQVCQDQLVPQLLAGLERRGALPEPQEVWGFLQHAIEPSLRAANPMATAAVEMALLDAGLQRQGCSLAEYLGSLAGGVDGVGGRAEHVPAGAAVGLGPRRDVVTRVQALINEGYRRVKVKITPATEAGLLADLVALRAGSAVDIQLDANGSFGHDPSDRAAHVAQMARLANAGFGAIEQPFPPSEVALTAELVKASPVPIVADEAASSLAAVRELLGLGAVSGVSIKSSRLGGLREAAQLHHFGHQVGLALTPGGMVESGLGRHALAALGALPGFTLTGDVGPAARWLTVDPWPDIHFSAATGMVSVPTTPGIAPAPDRLVLERQSVRHRFFASNG